MNRRKKCFSPRMADFSLQSRWNTSLGLIWLIPVPSWWERLEAHIAFLWVLPTLSFRYIDVISHKCCSLVFLLIIPFITEFQRDTQERPQQGAHCRGDSCYCIWKLVIGPLKTFLSLSGERGGWEALRTLNEGAGPLEDWLLKPSLCNFTESLYALLLCEKANYGTFQHSP